MPINQLPDDTDSVTPPTVKPTPVTKSTVKPVPVTKSTVTLDPVTKSTVKPATVTQPTFKPTPVTVKTPTGTSPTTIIITPLQCYTFHCPNDNYYQQEVNGHCKCICMIKVGDPSAANACGHYQTWNFTRCECQTLYLSTN